MSSPAAVPGTVYLAGAGPGDPNLLTLRVLRLLETASVILTDDLVSPEILALANSAAEIVPVGKRCGQPRITQHEINDLLVQHARRKRSVLRLKSGDPLVFGRIGEEIAALRNALIPFEIVPGITTAFAVAAALKTPLTERSHSSKLILATAHHADGKVHLQPAWSPDSTSGSTLAIYMPGRKFRSLADELIASGLDAGTPCVAVSKATTPDEQTHITTLAAIDETQIGPAPVILLVGTAIDPFRRTKTCFISTATRLEATSSGPRKSSHSSQHQHQASGLRNRRRHTRSRRARRRRAGRRRWRWRARTRCPTTREIPQTASKWRRIRSRRLLVIGRLSERQRRKLILRNQASGRSRYKIKMFHRNLRKKFPRRLLGDHRLFRLILRKHSTGQIKVAKRLPGRHPRSAMHCRLRSGRRFRQGNQPSLRAPFRRRNPLQRMLVCEILLVGHIPPLALRRGADTGH
jgi:uroporphyrin-III C-methyltransferase